MFDDDQDSQLRNRSVLPRRRVQGPARRWPALVLRPAGQGQGGGRLAARAVAGPREARRDRQVGCAEGPRRRARPEGPRAGAGLDRRPVQPRPAAGPVRLLDHVPRGRRRGDRRPQGPLRAQGPPGDRPLGAGRAAAGRLRRRAGPRAACCSRTAATSRRCRRASTPSGRTWPRSRSCRWTCARRCSTSAARRS